MKSSGFGRRRLHADREIFPFITLAVALGSACDRPSPPVHASGDDVGSVSGPPPKPAPLGTSPTSQASAEPVATSEETPVLERVATSADGSRILALRKTSDEPLLRDLVIADADGSAEEVLVKAEAASVIEGTEVPQRMFFNIDFDPRGDRVFFSVAHGRNEEIFAVDRKTRKIKRIAAGFGFEHVLVPSGPHKGDLLLVKHEYAKDGSGSYDVCVLVDGRTGKQLRDLTHLEEGCGASSGIKKALGF